MFDWFCHFRVYFPPFNLWLSNNVFSIKHFSRNHLTGSETIAFGRPLFERDRISVRRARIAFTYTLTRNCYNGFAPSSINKTINSIWNQMANERKKWFYFFIACRSRGEEKYGARFVCGVRTSNLLSFLYLFRSECGNDATMLATKSKRRWDNDRAKRRQRLTICIYIWS